MKMPGRSWNNGSYRYGFNGKEEDDDIKGEGNSLDFGARIYDPRIGRWLSVDPLQQKYPAFSPYNFALNNPNFYYDIDGKDVGVTITRNPQGGGTITFYSTTYVTGVDAEQKVKLYNEAFQIFIDANPVMKTSDGKWDVKVKMEFKVASADDVKRITNNAQEMAAENMMNIKTPSPGDARAHSGMPVPGSADKRQIVNVALPAITAKDCV
jgi:RHS repeat-associated protein